MIQGGDPEGTGLGIFYLFFDYEIGGQSIYGALFNDEFHSRLKFNHRGIVAMANENKPNNNGSQFFITLDQCPWLDKKHTIFGKVVGDTLYNLMAIGEEDTDSSERPINPPRIKRCEIVLNPFDDIFPRDLPKKATEKQTVEKPKVKKPVEYFSFFRNNSMFQNNSNMNLLSFADAEDFEAPKAVQQLQPKKIVSSHDALNDPSLSKQYAVSPEVLAKEREKLKELEEKKEKLKQEISEKKQKTVTAEPVPIEQSASSSYTKFDEKMKSMMLKKRRLMDDLEKIEPEDNAGQDDDPVVKADDKKKSARGFVQKTKGADLDEEKNESGSEGDEDEFLTAEQKY